MLCANSLRDFRELAFLEEQRRFVRLNGDLGELADGHHRTWVDHRRDERGHAATIGKAGIKDSFDSGMSSPRWRAMLFTATINELSQTNRQGPVEAVHPFPRTLGPDHCS